MAQKHYLVEVSFYKPYERKFTYRVQASHQLRAPAAALKGLKAEPALKGKRLGDVSMGIRVTPMGTIGIQELLTA